MCFISPDNFFTGKSCWHCVHYKTEFVNEDGLIVKLKNCDAFPAEDGGIPMVIYNEGHYKVRHDLGQKNDIVFEPDTKKIKVFEAQQKMNMPIKQPSLKDYFRSLKLYESECLESNHSDDCTLDDVKKATDWLTNAIRKKYVRYK